MYNFIKFHTEQIYFTVEGIINGWTVLVITKKSKFGVRIRKTRMIGTSPQHTHQREYEKSNLNFDLIYGTNTVIITSVMINSWPTHIIFLPSYKNKQSYIIIYKFFNVSSSHLRISPVSISPVPRTLDILFTVHSVSFFIVVFSRFWKILPVYY